MKLLLFVFIFFPFLILHAQFSTPAEHLIKKYKIKDILIYSFKQNSDSTLSETYSFDTTSKKISHKMFDMFHEVELQDTFIYDNNHFLIKSISTGKDHKNEISYTNDDKGRATLLEYSGTDSGYSGYGIFSYDTKGNLVSSITYFYNGDTIIINSHYNEKNLITKYTIQDKLNGLVVIINSYDSRNRLLHRDSFDSTSKSFMDFRYDKKDNNSETITKRFYKNREEVSRSLNKYYDTGLIYSQKWIVNDKLISLWKYYYIYY